MPWWTWVLIGVGVSAAGVAVVFAFRDQLRYVVKVAKALVTDKRLPRPLRWALTVALAIKVVPFPDFGLDEVILVVVGLLLLTVYRPTFRAILDEVHHHDEAITDVDPHEDLSGGSLDPRSRDAIRAPDESDGDRQPRLTAAVRCLRRFERPTRSARF